MYRKLIIFLLRKKFGLRKYQAFKFSNQKSKLNCYYFSDNELMKEDIDNCELRPSNVKFNYLISDECEIKKVVE